MILLIYFDGRRGSLAGEPISSIIEINEQVLPEPNWEHLSVPECCWWSTDYYRRYFKLQKRDASGIWIFEEFL
jgi:hypothetical protein